MKNKKLLVLATLLTAGLFVGCAGGQEIPSEVSIPTSSVSEPASTPSQTVVTVTGVTISGAARNLNAAETCQLSAVVALSSGEDKLGVTWTTSNENVATVSEAGLVTALSVSEDTEVTITATSKKDSSKTASVKITVKKDETKSLFGDKANMTNGERAAALANPGTFIEWHDQGWCGGTTTVHKAETENNTFTLTYESTDGEPFYGMQLFYKNPELVNGTPYKLSMKVNSTQAGSITINGKTVTLVVGDNDVEVAYIESASQGSIDIQMGVDGVGTVYGATIVAEVKGWTDISANKVDLAAPTNVAVTAKDGVAGAYIVSFDSVEHAAGYMYSIYKADGTRVGDFVACATGDTIDLRTQDSGTYTVKVQAVGDGLEYSDSAATEATITHTKPEAVSAQTYRLALGDEAIACANGEVGNAGNVPTYWNDQGWCGSNTAVDYCDAKGDQIQVKFSGATINFGFQLFLMNSNVNSGSKYTLKMNIWSDTAGKIKIQGQEVTLAVGDNIVAVTYTAATTDQYGNATCTGIHLLNNEVQAATLKMSNIRWTEVMEGVEDTDVGTACEEPAAITTHAVTLSKPEGVVFNASTGVVAFANVTNAESYKVTVYSNEACTTETAIKDVAVTNGGKVDVSSLEAGTYYLKVFAVNGEVVSVGSDAKSFTIEAPVDPSTPVTIEGNITVLAKGSSKTRIEGAGAWIWIDPTTCGLTGENIGSAKATATIEMKDAGGNAVARSATEVVVSDLAAGHARVYVIMDGAPGADWTTKITFQIKVGDKVYQGVAEYVGLKSTLEEEEKPVDPSQIKGTATILAKNSNDNATRVEGAGVWIWVDPSSVGITGENIGSVEKSATVEMKDGGGNVVATAAVSDVIVSDLITGAVRVYVILNMGPGADWTTTINFTIRVGSDVYTGTASFTGSALNVA